MPQTGTNKNTKESVALPLLQALPRRREKLSPCRAACPLENHMPQWIEHLKGGDYAAAWQILKAYNPFPAITGYCCYRFCEEECNRSHWDESIAIGELEKAVGLWRLENYGISKTSGGINPPAALLNNFRAAVLGSGPAGLSCAFYLKMLGAAVTVFETLPVAGGLLATGIPEQRLPRAVLAQELAILQAEGIIIKTGVSGEHILTPTYLEEQFDAVVLATGAQESVPLQVKGEDLPGVRGAVDYLRDYHLGNIDKLPGPVVVTGGGNAALDAAVAACRAGAGEVTLLYRRSREEMPAHPSEVAEAESAGVRFLFQAAITEIGRDNSLEKVFIFHTAPSQRGQAVNIIPGTASTLPCRTLLTATGQRSSLSSLLNSFSCNPGEKEHLEAGNAVTVGEEVTIMAAGDAVSGPGNVARAIFSGRQAARKIFDHFQKRGKLEHLEHHFHVAPARHPEAHPVTFASLNPYFYPRRKREELPQQEAARCFSCGFCNSCGVCWNFCPDLAVRHDGNCYDFISTYCKSCNICVSQCPANALEMLEPDDKTVG